MATAGHRLLSRIVQSGDLEEVIAYGIDENYFLDEQNREVWKHILAYWKAAHTRGSVLSPEAFQERFSHFELVDSPHMTTAALCHDVVEDWTRVQLKEQAAHAVELADINPAQAIVHLRQAMDSLVARNASGTDVHFSSRITEILHNYELKESGMIQPVFHWPWEPLDVETGGVSEEDYILLWGRPKSMKSFVLTYAMAEAFEQGLRVLCYTKEMTPDNMLLRTAAFLVRIPYRETRLAKLSADDRQLLFMLDAYVKEQSAATGGRNDLIVLSGRDSDGRDGVTWLSTKFKQYKPDICFVDGLYLMNDDRGGKRVADWQRVMHISRDVRQLILDTRIPVIATMQANRAAAKNNGAELDEIAYSDGVGQDITQGFRVVNERNSPTIALIAGGSREYQLHGVRIHGIPCQDFTFKELMTEKDIQKAERDDAKSAEPENPDVHAAVRKPRLVRGDTVDKLLNKQLKGL